MLDALPSQVVLALICAASAASYAQPADSEQRVFDTPIQAADALIDACRADDTEALRAIFGTEHADVYETEDVATETAGRLAFAEASDDDLLFRVLDDRVLEIVVGFDLWPVPIPLVREAGGWRFDTAAGADELINRRIGTNELLIIDVCQTIIAAQEQFRDRDWDGDGHLDYADKWLSTEGAFDGLYWPADEEAGIPPSPLDAYVTSNADYLAKREAGAPIRGYRGAVLRAQGPAAPGGTMSYEKDGHLHNGWALIAWPAEYGVTGIMTFLASHHGIIYERDLGEATPETAEAITEFDPAEGWTPVAGF